MFVTTVPTGTKTKTWPHQQSLLTHSVAADAAHKCWANGLIVVDQGIAP